VGASGADTADGTGSGAALVFVSQPAADLSLTLDDAPDPVVGLQPLTYTITVANAGPEDAGAIVVVQNLGAVAFESAGGTGWTCSHAGGRVSCTRPSLPPGPAPLIQVVVTAPPLAQLLASNAAVSAAELDPLPDNNADGETTAVSDAPQADLVLLKSDGGTPAEWGQPVTWTLSVSNAGPQAVSGARVRDVFPPGVAAVSWTCAPAAGSSCPASGSGDLDAPVDMIVGGSVAFTATGTVQPGATTLVNTATVAPPAAIYDPDPLDNSATAVTPSAPRQYFAVPPCRVVDTRATQTPLAANTTRAFTLGGSCGIPPDARAVAGNLVAVNPGDRGDLRAFPAGQPLPPASVLNFAAGRTRANNAALALGAGGQVEVRCDMPAGSTASTHLVVDVYGYWR
jgi:uncharacterized repeat protein (TIGR01451 family)